MLSPYVGFATHSPLAWSGECKITGNCLCVQSSQWLQFTFVWYRRHWPDKASRMFRIDWPAWWQSLLHLLTVFHCFFFFLTQTHRRRHSFKLLENCDAKLWLFLALTTANAPTTQRGIYKTVFLFMAANWTYRGKGLSTDLLFMI